MLGDENENFVIVRKGLLEGNELCLIEPEGAADIGYSGLEIYAEMLKEKEALKLQAEKERDEMEKKQQEQAPGAANSATMRMK